MSKLHSWHIGLACILILLAWHFTLFAWSDDVYGTLWLGLAFVTLVHVYFTIRNGDRHESFVVIGAGYRRVRRFISELNHL